MAYPVNCHVCDDHRTISCSKCKGTGYLSRNWEVITSMADDTVICVWCFGTGFCPCTECGHPFPSDGQSSSVFGLDI